MQPQSNSIGVHENGKGVTLVVVYMDTVVFLFLLTSQSNVASCLF